MRHADTYWWKSCWIYRRQLMWCKTQHSKISFCSWVWARPNQCCTLSSRPWLVIAFYIRFGFLLISVCTTFFLVACYWQRARSKEAPLIDSLSLRYMYNKKTNKTGNGINVLNSWIINENENGGQRKDGLRKLIIYFRYDDDENNKEE